ncbi:GntR family transcriptional regulator [Flindersiella endophytica]
MKRERVREYLLDLIGSQAPGSSIPPERELCRQLGVSRPTLRAAVDELSQAGLLIRQQGRGTFTNRSKVTQNLQGSYFVPPADGEWRSRVLSFEIAAAGPRIGARLLCSPGDPVLHAVRLRLVDDEPMAIERLHLPAQLVAGLQAADLESGNFYQVLRMRYEVVVADAVQSIEPTVSDAEESVLLTVPLHSPALLFERATRDLTGRIVEYTRSIYRGDRYRLTSHLTFDSTSG